MTYVLWIAGGRYGCFQPSHVAVLARIPRPTLIVVGSQQGIDGEATRWARKRGIPVRTVYAQWHIYGKAAGPRRNRDLARMADALMAFPGGRGTADAIRCAKNERIPALHPCEASVQTLLSMFESAPREVRTTDTKARETATCSTSAGKPRQDETNPTNSSEERGFLTPGNGG